MSIDEADSLFKDLFDALEAEQRRKLLIALLDHNPQGGAPIDGEFATTDQVVEMHHVHLPKLVKYGFVEWDQENDEVHTGPNFEEVRPFLELLDDHADDLPDGWP